MRTTMPCPSDLALEQHILGELGSRSVDVGDHVAGCETCLAKVAGKAADTTSFAISSAAETIRNALLMRQQAMLVTSPSERKAADTREHATAGAGAPIAPRRRVLPALALAAALAVSLVVAVRLHSTSLPSFVAPATSAYPGENDETEVLRVQREWMEAIRDKDADTLDRILADDYIYTDSRGTVSNKADSLRQARSTGGRLKAFHTTDEQARIYGDLAIVTGLLRVEGVSAGREYDAEVRFTDILARIDGRWRAVAAHASTPPSERRSP